MFKFKSFDQLILPKLPQILDVYSVVALTFVAILEIDSEIIKLNECESEPESESAPANLNLNFLFPLLLADLDKKYGNESEFDKE